MRGKEERVLVLSEGRKGGGMILLQTEWVYIILEVLRFSSCCLLFACFCIAGFLAHTIIYRPLHRASGICFIHQIQETEMLKKINTGIYFKHYLTSCNIAIFPEFHKENEIKYNSDIFKSIAVLQTTSKYRSIRILHYFFTASSKPFFTIVS